MKTILLIEDNADISENTAEILGLEGYHVLVAFDGQKGLEFVRQDKPDIILCDVMMPGISGYEVLKALKADIETAEIPFVFFSASTEKSEIDVGLSMGANEYIRKPFEANDLIEVIKRCLNEN